MLLKRLLIIVFIVFSLSQVAQAEENWQKFIKKSGGSIALGSLIGVVLGKSCSYSENYVPFFITWLLAYMLRHGIVCSLKNNMNEANIEYDSFLLENSAFVAAWLSYFYPVNRQKN